jgi:hypothetical protein
MRPTTNFVLGFQTLLFVFLGRLPYGLLRLPQAAEAPLGIATKQTIRAKHVTTLSDIVQKLAKLRFRGYSFSTVATQINGKPGNGPTRSG